MIRIRMAIGLSSLLVAMMLACFGHAKVVQAQSAFALDGSAENPLSAASGKVVVLVFLRRDCPISSRYAPVIQKISAEYERDTRFSLVFPDKSDTAQDINKYLQDYGYHLPALRDPEHVLVSLGRAEITPEVALFDSNRLLLYHGRIDNWYAEFGRSRPAPTTHELSDAIEAALAGKPVAKREVKGVGCYISDLE